MKYNYYNWFIYQHLMCEEQKPAKFAKNLAGFCF